MTYVIHDQRQLRALASPVRQAILDVLATAGPCTLRDLARYVDRPVSALYHHVRRLRACGLVIDREGTGERGRPASRIDVPGRPLVLQYAPEVPQTARPMRRIVNAMVRAAARDFARGYQPGVTVMGEERRLWATRSEAHLSLADLRAVNSLLRQLNELFHKATPHTTGRVRLHSLSFVLAPCRATPGARRRRPPPE